MFTRSKQWLGILVLVGLVTLGAGWTYWTYCPPPPPPNCCAAYPTYGLYAVKKTGNHYKVRYAGWYRW